MTKDHLTLIKGGRPERKTLAEQLGEAFRKHTPKKEPSEYVKEIERIKEEQNKE